MTDEQAICLAKTEFREAYNTGDVERLLAVFAGEFTDMSVGLPSFFGEESKAVLRSRMAKLFREYEAKLIVTIIAIRVLGNTALDFGWHEMTLRPHQGGEALTTRQRYFELWQKDADGKWRISLYIDNMDLPPAMPDATLAMPQSLPAFAWNTSATSS